MGRGPEGRPGFRGARRDKFIEGKLCILLVSDCSNAIELANGKDLTRGQTWSGIRKP